MDKKKLFNISRYIAPCIIGLLCGITSFLIMDKISDKNVVVLAETPIVLERPKIIDDDCLDVFIKSVCEAEGVPYYFALAILHAENPDRNPSAVNVNTNGTLDLGLWQLNSDYIFVDFVANLWKSTDKFNWADPKSNTILAIRHIAWLFKFGFSDYQVAVAYNKGYTAAEKDTSGNNDYARRVLRKEIELLQEAAKDIRDSS